jgi:hypothetical protein
MSSQLISSWCLNSGAFINHSAFSTSGHCKLLRTKFGQDLVRWPTPIVVSSHLVLLFVCGLAI